MRDNGKIKLPYKPFLVVVFLFLLALVPSIVLAAASVHGAAWWGEANKYLYFDCRDYETGSRFDAPSNFADAPDPLSFHFFIGSCVIEHHVFIDNGGNFSGSGWNIRRGKINFGGSTTPVTAPSYSFNSRCPSSCVAPNCSACYNSIDQRVYGWAQVSSTREYIKLGEYGDADIVGEDFLQLKSWSPSSTNPYYYGVNPGDFAGHASSTIGGTRYPLSFNCLSENGDGGAGNCAARDYKAYILNPIIGMMSAPNWSYSDACDSFQAKRAILRWRFAAGVQEGYEVVVSEINSPATSTAVCWSGRKDTALNSIGDQYAVPNASDLLPSCQDKGDLEYNRNYYWFVRIYYDDDSVSKVTDWFQYGTDTFGHEGTIYDEHTGIPADADGNPMTFTTYKHEFPVPYFTWTPSEVIVGSTTIFNALTVGSSSIYYSSSNPNIPISCEMGGCSYQWFNNDASSTISDPFGATTSMVFWRATGTGAVTLGITDPDLYYCERQMTLSINYGLPVWREVKAE